MFIVWNGNHCLQVQLPIISQDHAEDFMWHYIVESIVLNVKGDITTILATFHEVNW